MVEHFDFLILLYFYVPYYPGLFTSRGYRELKEIQVWLKRHNTTKGKKRNAKGNILNAFFLYFTFLILHFTVHPVYIPRTGGVTQAPRKTKKYGVKNL